MVNSVQRALLTVLGKTKDNVALGAEFRRKFMEANADAIERGVQLKLDAEARGTTAFADVVSSEERKQFRVGVRANSFFYDPSSVARIKIPKDFTEDDHAIMAHYLGDGFRSLNLQLRAGNYDAGKYMRETLSKFDTYTGVGFRGVDFPDHILDMYREGNIVRDKGFGSFSKYLEGAKSRSTLLRIFATSGRDISEYSKYRFEAEFILPDRVPMKVIYRQDPTPHNQMRYIDLLEV
ncbi:hypothetical protein [Nocardia sp. NPDC003963]